ncbi:extracellular solute-binding protein [Ectopseudomonas mendocina]|uniref:Transporter substrate-binding domain-containing protein n=1 Tax=Ectopseudomonas mendocina TaxID=300 RepID=A0ABD7RWH7_ECTME|nr:transporter substrate-binding domain-containing protein [Pseudomonas mendocina]TRO15006.1 transporter substrate-binding domain-containing protein [Pseudomonas mendocina]TRO18333.1 transporter substrate-binding domain-containing protein [Pseudomonas mendocina]SUD36932.1 extracellular solute-binding protein [Pseudomonas mendocina]
MNLKYPVAVLLLLGSLSAHLSAAELRLYTEDYRPFSYLQDGKPSGMAVAVIEALIRRTGETAHIELVPWTRGYHQVRHQADSALFSTVRTVQREAEFQWVGPIARGHTRFYTLKDAGLRVASLDDVRQLGTLAIPKQWYSYELLREQNLQNLYGVSTPQDMLRMFRHGRVKLLLANTLTLDGMLAEQGMHAGQLQAQFDLMPNDSYIAFSLHTDAARVARWQSALQDMRHDGSLERIYRHWFPHVDERALADLLRAD